MDKFGYRKQVGTVSNVAPRGNHLTNLQTTELNPPAYPMALVYWADACGGDPGWISLDEVEDDGETMVQTVGFLLAQDDAGGKPNHVTLLQSFHDGEGINLFYIPVAMVRKIILLSA